MNIANNNTSFWASSARLGAIAICLSALILGSCGTMPEANITPTLTNKTAAIPVKGMNWQAFNQKLSFGEFSTEKVKRGWATSYSFPFFINFSGAKQKMQFNLTDGTRHSEVFCLQRIKREDLPSLNQIFNIPITYANVYAGTIILDGNKDKTWEFVIQNPNQDNPLKQGIKERLEGFVKSDAERFEIESINGYKKGDNALTRMAISGYEVRQNGKTIGAVETFGRGRTWLDPSLDADTKFVVANVLSAIMLRTNIQ